MKIKEFRVTAFRSVVDTGWLVLSTDGVTALVGQNESGKSAILDALATGFSKAHAIDADDFRRGKQKPEISLRLELSSEEVADSVSSLPSEISEAAAKILHDTRKDIVLSAYFFFWEEKQRMVRAFKLERSVEESIRELLSRSTSDPEGDQTTTRAESALIMREEIVSAIRKLVPSFVLFREELSFLPNFVDIDEDKKTWLDNVGEEGANNFLASAGLRLPDLLIDDDRERSSLISTAVRSINLSLASYWTQVLGGKGRIKLEVEFSRHSTNHPALPGKAYLRFWISEGDGEKLHPSQRSKGTRWYVAFFLQLTAAQRDNSTIFLLLDEPGAYLHATAQGDVLRLITTLANSIPVIYSTHSPYLIDHKRIDRILAVERDTSNENSDTIVRSGLALAASSHLTLAPVLALMGTDLSTQQIIKREGNVLLEENSAYFYLSAFVLLTGIGRDLALVACNGADNVKLVADLFIAWRLDYKIALDDDDKGRRVSREIKKKWMISDNESARRIVLFDHCLGVEDAIEREDFQRLICPDNPLPAEQTNAKAVEALKLSKPLLAHGFFSDVSRGVIGRADVSDITLGRFIGWLNRLSE